MNILLFPTMRIGVHQTTRGCRHCRLVGSSGVEPPTSCLSGMRSNLLSYEPFSLVSLPRHLVFVLLLFFSPLVEMKGIEPLTPCLQGRCSPSWATPPYSWDFLTVPENRTTNFFNALFLVVFLFSLWVREYFHILTFSIERRWSSRTFRYGYLVTT